MQIEDNALYKCPGCGHMISGLEIRLAKYDYKCNRCMRYKYSEFKFAGKFGSI
jgi:predicted RNA-binding Zn-ribbon protein involved in translation (DUF1610 family)